MIPYLADTPVLTTERLKLRAPNPGDWESLRSFAATDRADYLGGPYDLASAWRVFCHIAGMWAVRGYGSFVFTLKDDDTPIGMAGPWHPAEWPEQEIGWALWDPSAEGKGLAFEAANEALNFAYTTLQWPTAVSYIAPANTRSIALAERLGATRDAAAKAPTEGDYVFRHRAPGDG